MVKRNGLWLHFSWTTYCQITFVRSNSLKLILNWVLLNHAPSSTQLISASTQLSATPSTLFEPKYPHHWAISPNLGRKIQSCPSGLKIGTRGILEVLIQNLDLDVSNFNSKIHFWADLGRKNKSGLFYLKTSTNGISRMLILISTYVFWISNPKFILGQIWFKKVKVVRFAWKLVHMVFWGCWFLFQHYFLNFQPKSHFWAILHWKRQSYVLPENWHTHTHTHTHIFLKIRY